LLDLVWPSLLGHWRQAVYALPHVLGRHIRPEIIAPEPDGSDSPDLENRRRYATRKLILAEVFTPVPGHRPMKAAIGLIDPRGPGEGEDELREWLGEVFKILPNPSSGTLEVRLATVDGNLQLVRWRRRIAVGMPPAPPKVKIEPEVDVPDNVDLRVPQGGIRVPILVHVPHSSTVIPARQRRSIALTDEELEAELLAMTDRHTEALFRSVTGIGGAMFVNRLSRLVVDPERFPSDDDEPMAARGMGAVYTSTSSGAPLRKKPFRASDRAKLMRAFHEPYAKALEALVTEIVERFGVCVIIDAHSFPSRRLPYEDRGRARPEICLGHEPFHAGEELPGVLEGLLREKGLEVLHNTPFAGSYVPLRHYKKDRRVRSIMVEVRRDLYMDEATGDRSGRFREVAAVMGEAIKAAATVGLRAAGCSAEPKNGPGQDPRHLAKELRELTAKLPGLGEPPG